MSEDEVFTNDFPKENPLTRAHARSKNHAKIFSREWSESTDPKDRAKMSRAYGHFVTLEKLRGSTFPTLARFEKSAREYLKLHEFLTDNGIPPLLYLRYLANRKNAWPSNFVTPASQRWFWSWCGKQIGKVVLKSDKLSILRKLSSEDDPAYELFSEYVASNMLKYSSLQDRIAQQIDWDGLSLIELTMEGNADWFEQAEHDKLNDTCRLLENDSVRSRTLSLLRENGYAEKGVCGILAGWNIPVAVEDGEARGKGEP